jgi:hypothetical protein
MFEKEAFKKTMLKAFRKTVKALKMSDDMADMNSALVAAGEIISAQIDTSIATGSSEEKNKALYLIPHLTNVLRELGATPEMQKNLTSVYGNKQIGKLEQLRIVANDFTRQKRA